MSTFITLSPAYGRDYRSSSAAIEDFEAGKDFIYHDISSRYDGKPCSIRDFPNGTDIKLRYNNLRSLTVFPLIKK